MELISKEEVFRILAESSDVEVDIDNLPMIFLGDELVCDTVTAWNKGYMAGQNDRPKGKWIKESDGKVMGDGFLWNCSECGQKVYVDSGNVFPNFCERCGADMRGEE